MCVCVYCTDFIVLLQQCLQLRSFSLSPWTAPPSLHAGSSRQSGWLSRVTGCVTTRRVTRSSPPFSFRLRTPPTPSVALVSGGNVQLFWRRLTSLFFFFLSGHSTLNLHFHRLSSSMWLTPLAEPTAPLQLLGCIICEQALEVRGQGPDVPPTTPSHPAYLHNYPWLLCCAQGQTWPLRPWSSTPSSRTLQPTNNHPTTLLLGLARVGLSHWPLAMRQQSWIRTLHPTGHLAQLWKWPAAIHLQYSPKLPILWFWFD